jgi:hypothetical protein
VFIRSSLNRPHHLDDDAIAALWSARAAATTDGEAWTEGPATLDGVRDESHLQGCVQCRARYDAFADWLSDARVEAIGEADDIFSADRLAAQQAQILRRLETLGRPARVIAFPRFSGSVAVDRRGPERWIAAAAAAGLIVGLGAGELLDIRRSMGGTASTHLTGQVLSPVGQAARGALQPVVLSSDDAFLYDVDATSTSPRVEALQALDALTPRVRDVDQAR